LLTGNILWLDLLFKE